MHIFIWFCLWRRRRRNDFRFSGGATPSVHNTNLRLIFAKRNLFRVMSFKISEHRVPKVIVPAWNVGFHSVFSPLRRFWAVFLSQTVALKACIFGFASTFFNACFGIFCFSNTYIDLTFVFVCRQKRMSTERGLTTWSPSIQSRNVTHTHKKS